MEINTRLMMLGPVTLIERLAGVCRKGAAVFCEVYLRKSGLPCLPSQFFPQRHEGEPAPAQAQRFLTDTTVALYRSARKYE